MNKTIKKHFDTIQAGTIEKTTVIGLRKALNATNRKSRGYSVSSTAATMTNLEFNRLLDKHIPKHRPRVQGELHKTGVELLQKKRYARQLASVADIVADLDHFRLVGFDFVGPQETATPVYRAYDTKGRSFPFRNVPWQAGGCGPEIVSANYW